MRTYATHAASWRAYQPLLPPALRLAGDDVPCEQAWSWDGLDVHLDVLHADGPAVVLLHGGGGYGRLLAPFGRVLRALGCRVVLPDLPGYGLTACPPRAMRYERWVACAAALATEEAERAGAPVALLGASMGGMLALHAAGAAPAGAVAAVAATTLLDPRAPAVRRGVGRVPLPGTVVRGLAPLDGVRLPVALMAPVERMSSLREVNRLVRRDPQAGRVRAPLGFFRSWLTYDPPVEPEHFDRCPVLLAHPLADRWTPPEWSLDVLRRIPAPTTYVGLEGCEHVPLEEPGLTTLRSTLEAWVSGLPAAGARSSPGPAAPAARAPRPGAGPVRAAGS